MSSLKLGVMLPSGLAIAACAVAPPPTVAGTTTPLSTRTPIVIISPTPPRTPDTLLRATIEPSLQAAGLPACSRPGNIELSELTLAFVADWDGDWDIYSVKADGSGLIQIAHNETSDDGPKWSPDGRRMAYIHDFVQMPRLAILDVEQGNLSIVAPDLEVSSDVVWSGTGEHIVFRSEHDLFAVDVQSGDRLNLTKGAPFLVADLPTGFSPEGDRMIFDVAMPAEPGLPEDRLCIVGVDGTGLAELSFPLGEADWPMWHPRRDEVLFQAFVQSDGVGLYVATLDGSVRKLQSALDSIVPLPSWSPDGTMIAWVMRNSELGTAERPQNSLHAATADEDVNEVVLDGSAGGDRGVGIYRYYWAPDSRHIAYTMTNEVEGFPTGDVFVFDIGDGRPQLVVEAVEMFSDLSWRPLP